jgi:predicted dehydrogenase
MTLGIGIVGAGYWGPNLVRNFSASALWEVRAVCDADVERARKAVGRYSTIRVTTDFDDLLDDESVDAIAIATPASTHFALASAALDAGKHVLVEKPLASTEAESEKLVQLAADSDRTLMCDHTYCYTPAVSQIRKLVTAGDLGDIQYIDSVRINLGLIQHDIDVVWDLLPHDLSIMDAILPADRRPTAVAAHGADPVGAGHACMAYLAMPLDGGGMAHAHVNWLSPVKIRTMIIGGSRRILVWDDMSITQRVTLYDKGADLTPTTPDSRERMLISYRTGEMVAPALSEREALSSMVEEFASAISEKRAPLTDGEAGLRVVRALNAASTSLGSEGSLVPIAGADRLVGSR